MKRRWGDRDVAYDDRGPGTTGTQKAPIVLLHPFPFDRRYWTATAAALSSNRRVIAVDSRGFGESSAAAPFTIADLADDLAALLGELGISSAVVVGLSMGGYVALALAQRHPGRLAALVLADTRAAADTPEARRGRAEAVALIREAGVDTYLARSLPRLLAPSAGAPLLAEARALAETRADRLIAGIAALRDRPDRTAELAAISCPTLVLAGTLDQIVPVDEMRGMSAAIPGARFVVLDGAGHLSSLERPAPFAAALRAFVEDAAALRALPDDTAAPRALPDDTAAPR
jgi:3-oxoadipate enol-lactonase